MGVEEQHNLVFHDGAYLSEEDIIKAAKGVGDLTHAEHYLISLLCHALLYKKQYLLKTVNEIRKYYNYKFSPPEGAPASSNNMPDYGNQEDNTNDDIRKNYQIMSRDERVALLKECLVLLRVSDSKIFSKKQQWIGIYLVIRDRLDGRLSKTDFVILAKDSTPADWPETLSISDNTMSNFGRYVKYEDRDEVYYEMNDNPFDEICQGFWNIVKKQILTRN